MRELSKAEIEKINHDAPYNQGIFKEPFGIPDFEKRMVVYQMWETGGISGGSCWENSNPQHYSNSEPVPEWTALDEVLEILAPSLTFLQFRKISKLIHSTSESQWEYYGNQTDYGIKYIVLEELEKFCDGVNK